MERSVEVKILKPELMKTLSQNGGLPFYATASSAGVDLLACLPESVTIPGDGTAFIPTGIAVYLKDPSLCAVVMSRSGLGTKQGLVVKQGVGLIDADYQGEIMVAIHNISHEPKVIQPGDRIAQMVLMPVFRAQWVAVEDFTSATARGAGGFGSTGVSVSVTQ